MESTLIRIHLTKSEWKRLIDFADENQLLLSDVASSFIASRIEDLPDVPQPSNQDSLDQMQLPSVIF